MVIAIMMRAMDQDSGFRAIVENLVENLIQQSNKHFFLLIYNSRKNFGRFANYKNVKEVLARLKNKFIWDQLIVPYIAVKEKADLIFNPKFSVPLFSPVPVAICLQENGFFTNPQYYEKLDVLYQRIMMPLYVKKSDILFSISKYALEINKKILNINPKKIEILYSGVNEKFKPIDDNYEIQKFKQKYTLPEKFILSVTRVDHPGIQGSTSFYGGKNPEVTYRAFKKIRNKIPHYLVFAGKRIKEYLEYTEGNDADFTRIIFTDFIQYDEMPLLFNAADLFVNAAPNEGFGMVNVEAMACGKAVVLADSGASAEVGENAAIFAQAGNANDFAEKILFILSHPEDKALAEKASLNKVKEFSLKKSARKCIEIFERKIIPSESNHSNLIYHGGGDVGT